jgi:uncharacterized membrane protein (UPF0182 family)
MVARSDGEHYGKLQVFQFPKQTLVFGPQQVVGASRTGSLAADRCGTSRAPRTIQAP